MFKIEFSFINALGRERRDDLSNNGQGYNRADAEDIARQLKDRGNFDIKIVQLRPLMTWAEISETIASADFSEI